MSKQFDPVDFVNRVARRLIMEFDDTGQAGTSDLIGAAKEHPARRSLERLLPGSATVGTGLIIDSYGSVSRQQDVVVYEKDFCPVFSINDTPEATYYPCEGVIAVGEIKSSLGNKELEDAFIKIASVKRLRRRAVATNDGVFPDRTVSPRVYGSPMAMATSKKEQFDQTKNSKDQIYGFVLCGRFGLKPGSIVESAIKLWKEHQRFESPNIIVSLEDGFLQPYVPGEKRLVLSALDGDAVAFSAEASKGMGCLLGLLNSFVRTGRTVEVDHFKRYFLLEGGIAVSLVRSL